MNPHAEEAHGDNDEDDGDDNDDTTSTMGTLDACHMTSCLRASGIIIGSIIATTATLSDHWV